MVAKLETTFSSHNVAGYVLMNRWDIASGVCGNTTGYFWWIVGWNHSLQDISSTVCGDTTRHFWQVIGTFSSCDIWIQTCLRSLWDISRYLWLVWTSLWLQKQKLDLFWTLDPLKVLAVLTWDSCYLLIQKSRSKLTTKRLRLPTGPIWFKDLTYNPVRALPWPFDLPGLP